MIEIIKNIAVVIGCISGMLTLIFMISKKFRCFISIKVNNALQKNKNENKLESISNKLDTYIKSDEEFKKSLREDMDIQKDFARDQCRNTIKDIFFRYCNIKKIPLYELKTADYTYTTYHNKLEANSYISLLYNEIKKWEIDYTHSFETDDN